MLGTLFPTPSAFFKKIFLTWTNFKVFIEFATILLLFYVLVFWPQGMWDLSSPTRDGIRTPCIGRRSLNHWTTREVPLIFLCFAFVFFFLQTFFFGNLFHSLYICSSFLAAGILRVVSTWLWEFISVHWWSVTDMHSRYTAVKLSKLRLRSFPQEPSLSACPRSWQSHLFCLVSVCGLRWVFPELPP